MGLIFVLGLVISSAAFGCMTSQAAGVMFLGGGLMIMGFVGTIIRYLEGSDKPGMGD